MELERAYGPGVVNAALDTVAKCASLVVSADKKKHLLGVANGTYAHGKRGFRNLVGVVAEEAGVCYQRVGGQCANACSRGEGGEGLVEGNVSVNAAAAEEQINSAKGRNLILVSLALGIKVLSHTVQYVYVLRRDIYVIEEIIVHKVPIALVMLSRKSYVFVHIEGYDVLEAYLACLIHSNKPFVNAKGRGARRQAKDEWTVLLVIVYSVSNMLRRPIAHRVVVVLNNQFHAVLLYKSIILCHLIISLIFLFVNRIIAFWSEKPSTA